MREVREEAGVEARLVEDLGEVRYFYARGGRRIAKLVEFFLLEYVSGHPDEHDHEVEEARWMPLEEAARQLTYQGEREMVARALSRTSADG
jgi:8-oxo-dGTP pyrophosphatase MutT (NUDIX family)